MEMTDLIVKGLCETTGIDFTLTDAKYNEDEETLYLTVSYTVEVPLEYITIDIVLPEGTTVTDEEIEELTRDYEQG